MVEKSQFFEKYFLLATTALQEADILTFTESIGSGIAYAQGNFEWMARITFLKLKGFFELKQYAKFLQNVSDVHQYHAGSDLSEIILMEAMIHTAQGEPHKALMLLNPLIPKITDDVLTIRLYDYLIQTHLCSYDLYHHENDFRCIHTYLERLKNLLAEHSAEKVWRFLNNCGIYYTYVREYDLAVDFFNQAINSADNINLARLYNNLAESILLSIVDEETDLINLYTQQAERLGEDSDNYLEIGRAHYILAQYEALTGHFLRAIDSFYLAIEFFQEAGEFGLAFDALQKIITLVSKFIEYVGRDDTSLLHQII